ncbi:uncharacterized protein A4U43_C04F7010 [Asparagus officinalis]|uniref:DYW domain-containing protein n=1 Tax=Asparagus officinalis TaxID=4686 RepID=A0A5P1EYW6_ASPOF|nr:uncharacterized protein A4U43_C04F7010 [Asparagus officinalis]
MASGVGSELRVEGGARYCRRRVGEMKELGVGLGRWRHGAWACSRARVGTRGEREPRGAGEGRDGEEMKRETAIKQAHAQAITTSMIGNLGVANKLVYTYAQFRALDDAHSIFYRMKERDNVTWSIMVGGFAKIGEYENCLRIFRDFVRSGSRIDNYTLPFALRACRDTQGACRIHGNINLAENAAKSLLELRPRHSGYYVLLSNIYANAGKWEDVAKVRELMTGRRVKKIPGWTWVEINNKTYQFRVGDKTHPQTEQIYDMLKVLSEKLEKAGYVPDTNFVLHDVDEELKAGFLYTHSEKLAIAYGLISTPEGTTIRITKNLRVCGDCHTFTKMVSGIVHREIVVRDANRFHHFNEAPKSVLTSGINSAVLAKSFKTDVAIVQKIEAGLSSES